MSMIRHWKNYASIITKSDSNWLLGHTDHAGNMNLGRLFKRLPEFPKEGIRSKGTDIQMHCERYDKKKLFSWSAQQSKIEHNGLQAGQNKLVIPSSNQG